MIKYIFFDKLTKSSIMKKVSYVCLCSFSLLLAMLPLQQTMGEQVSKTEMLTVQSVQQQVRKITGQVVDDKTGDPLIGVNVKVKGTTTGAITDLDGQFSLMVTAKNPVIIVSYIGYSQQETDRVRQSSEHKD